MQTPLEKYVEIVNFWKANVPDVYDVREGKLHPGYQAHHPCPEAFKKFKDEYKHEITRKLEQLYSPDETVLVPNRIHFELHVLLVKMYPERSQEWFRMSTAMGWFLGKRANSKFNMSAEEYAEAFSMNCESQRGKTHEELYGKEKADEMRKKMCMNNGNRSAIAQYTDDGVLVAQYETIGEAKRITGICKITEAAHGERKHAGGFVWKHVDPIKRRRVRDKDGNLVVKYTN